MLIPDPKNRIYQRACKRESEFRDGHDDYHFEIPKKVQEYENMMKYWDKKIDDIIYLKSLGKFNKGLSLGAWGGAFELNLLEYNIVESFHFIDISEAALCQLQENALKRWLSHRITTEIQDVNFISLVPDEYDFVSVINALHHVINLEELINEINRSLTQGGIFFTIDVVWEKKMYWTETRVSLVKTMGLHMKENKGISMREFIRTNPKILTNNCPFECIRSHELEDILLYYFNKTKIIHSTYRPLYFVRWWLIAYNDISDEYLDTLKLFDHLVYKNDICKSNRLLGIYKKSNVSLCYTKPWTLKEIKKNIGISIINERFLVKLSLKFITRFPRWYSFLKKLYFKIR